MPLTKTESETITEISGRLNDDLSEIQDIADKYRAKFDALSEKAQSGERGQALSELCDSLQEAADQLQAAVDQVDSIPTLDEVQ